MDESTTRHIEMIQGVISRLAGNSFMLKGWSVTVASALFALAAQNANERLVFIALYPALAFWALDAYYLRQERLFRDLYQIVTRDTEKSITPFSMETADGVSRVDGWFQTLWSPSIVLIHGPIVAVISAVTLYALHK